MKKTIRGYRPEDIPESKKQFYALVSAQDLREVGCIIPNYEPKYYYLDSESYKIYWMARDKRERELAKKDNDDSKIVDIKEGKRH